MIVNIMVIAMAIIGLGAVLLLMLRKESDHVTFSSGLTIAMVYIVIIVLAIVSICSNQLI